MEQTFHRDSGDRSAPARPLWHPYAAGVVLGLVLILTYILVGNGLGASGMFTRVAAEIGVDLAPEATRSNAYLGQMVADGRNPLASWIVFEVAGIAIGALLAAIGAGRFRLQLDRPGRQTFVMRFALALAGGALAGFGSRVAAGCTSGIGLSATAMLSISGFVFLIAFFIAGLVVSRLTRRIG